MEVPWARLSRRTLADLDAVPALAKYNADLPLVCPTLTPGIAEQQGHVVQTPRGFKEYNMSLISNSPIVALS